MNPALATAPSAATTDPLDPAELAEHIDTLTSALHDTYIGVARLLGNLITAKDPYTRGHLDRVYSYAMALTRKCAPELATQAHIGYGFLLHDIGKLGVPDQVLNKPGKLTGPERAIIETHPVLGHELVSPLKVLGEATMIVRHHHERWDGHGYPDGLRRDATFLPARILSIADAFDAMTSDRVYRAGMPVHVALEQITEHAGFQFDPDLATEFCRMVDNHHTSGLPLEQL